MVHYLYIFFGTILHYRIPYYIEHYSLAVYQSSLYVELINPLLVLRLVLRTTTATLLVYLLRRLLVLISVILYMIVYMCG